MSENPQAWWDEWKNQSLRIAEREIRNAIIEECARVVADWDLTDWDHDCDFKDVLAAIAAAIRALKKGDPLQFSG